VDLHTREFGAEKTVGTHFFKAHVRLWCVQPAMTYEVLVRRSFAE